MTPYFRRYFKQDAVKDMPPAGSGAPTPKVDAFGYATKEEPASAEPPKVETPGSGYDEKEPATPPVEEKKEPTKVEEKPPVVDPATGYGENEPEAPPAPTDEKKPEEKKPDEKPPEELKLNLEGLEKVDADKLTAFAKEQKLTPQAAQALVDFQRAERAASKKQAADYQVALQQEVTKVKQSWHKELKEDKLFGGENFKSSLQSVERVLQDYLPETKKKLTETKNMLPPYVMRDLAKLARDLYEDGPTVIGGDPVIEKKESGEKRDPLEFYT